MIRSKNQHKSENVRNILDQALQILDAIGIPFDNLSDRRLEKMAMAFLAVGDIATDFSVAKSTEDNHYLKTREIIQFENENFEENISMGSYDDIRRKDLILLVEAGVVVNSSTKTGAATNDPSRGYGLHPLFASLVRTYETSKWISSLENFKIKTSNLKDELKRTRQLQRIPVVLPSGLELELSLGEHNILQKKIIEDFLSRFGFNADILYIGDTSDKYLFKDEKTLNEIYFFTLKHDELPDIIAYSKDKNLLFLIEAVHSTGPMSEIRVRRLKKHLKKCTSKVIYVTAFLTRKDFRKWAVDIAWETEVWIADNPEHMIHFNGHKFLELY